MTTEWKDIELILRADSIRSYTKYIDAISISNNRKRVVIGISKYLDSSNMKRGAALIFEKRNSVWSSMIMYRDELDHKTGMSVSISGKGDRVVVGS
jgi:hypothetical protein